MFETLKKKYARFVIRRKFLRKHQKALSFNKILSNSREFFIVLPQRDHDFNQALDIIKYFLIYKKVITLFLPEHKYGLIPEREKYRVISYLPMHFTRCNLPAKNLLKRMKGKEFDIVIDLNREENLFCSAVSNFVGSKIRIGFDRNLSSNFYNMLINDKNEEAEVSYRNFLNYLKMF
jgi:hypothetical protein